MNQTNETKSHFQFIQSLLLRTTVERLPPIGASTSLAQRFLEHLGIATFETQASLTLHNLLGWERISWHKLPGTGPSWWPHYLIQSPQWPIRALTKKIRGQGKTTWSGWFYHQSLPEMRPCLREGGQSLQKKVLAGRPSYIEHCRGKSHSSHCKGDREQFAQERNRSHHAPTHRITSLPIACRVWQQCYEAVTVIEKWQSQIKPVCKYVGGNMRDMGYN